MRDHDALTDPILREAIAIHRDLRPQVFESAYEVVLADVMRDALGALRSDERAELRRRAAKPQGPRPLIR